LFDTVLDKIDTSSVWHHWAS